MFKLDMNAIRKSANDTWLMANAANAANLANESGKNEAEISQQPPKLAGLAKLAISQQLNCTLQADPASTQPPDRVQPPAPAPDKLQAEGEIQVEQVVPPVIGYGKPPKRTFMENADTWLHLDRAYQAHHFKCSTCIAAGRGAVYGLRCGVGAALWVAYETPQP